jgi:hypothetical protein
MATEADILERIRRGDLRLPPVNLRVLAEEAAGTQSKGQADLLIEALWQGKRFRFAAEASRLATPLAVEKAVAQASRLADPPTTYPMVIAPYLSEDRLEALERAQVSGLDLCGNGVLVVPGKMLVSRTGQPNQFPQSATIRNVYRGKNSIVARAFLLRPRFAQVKEIVEFVAERRGGVAFSTVSKVLKRLEDDLIVSREQGLIRLLQADTLMENLAANYEPPVVSERFRGKSNLPRSEVVRRLLTAAKATDARFAMTGAASAERQAVMASEPLVSCYCTATVGKLISEANIDAKETDRFPNVELLRTSDDRVFFDTRDEDGLPAASPIQTWLELATGDKRQKDAAQQVRRGILALLDGV